MSRVLGLDLGSNSVGWALIDEADGKLIAMGSRVFPEGVDRDKTGGERPNEIGSRQCRVTQVDASDMATTLGFQRGAQEGCLARAGFTQQQGERLGRRQAVLNIAERFEVPRRQEEKLRVRRELERKLAETVEGLIHS